ncbi:hypothetical protein HGI47_02795 [Novosphingobium sp. ERN07]|uniref:hypothetical protein n=1 Tax=Novosphingobium sp. ERN07 TaxID=2726187 RepID=UPI0014576724|nr:hypothetical protein [Novosphingobium sp. ERN07]NLR69804.1 hypothetical protein [Novosphingobium sp. ERN07]
MIRTALALATASALVFHLGGCQKGPASPSPDATEAITEAPATPALTLAPEPLPMVTPGEPSLARDPAQAMQALADAIEARDWKAVRGFWGDGGQRSGMDERAFAAKWSTLLAPVVTVGKGEQEGAAGSLYYTAPITIVDGPRTLKGEVVMRRVNDVPGATPEQLRWHIESTTLKP